MSEDNAVNRRKLLRRAGTVAAGVGAAGVASAIVSSPASASDGVALIQGDNAAGTVATNISSSAGTSTLNLTNSGAGAPLTLTAKSVEWDELGQTGMPDGSLAYGDDGYHYSTWGTTTKHGLVGKTYDTSWSSMPVPLDVPQRVLDTRYANTRGLVLNPGVLDAAGRLVKGQSLFVDLSDYAYFAWGVFGTLAAISPTAAGFMTAYPLGETRPATANLGFAANQNVSNSFFGATGSANVAGAIRTTGLAIFANVTTHVILDVFGFAVSDYWDVTPTGSVQGARSAQDARAARADLRAKTPRKW
ncbi:MAG: hypothetical protein HOU81_07310 [Hamadaea sp.]|uniref:hypothetical protein n=1 Tax=Hamadaea sp. TaxID=2024425 RepID=UPI0018087812|nr:hypothetical protein [Hamadaea sp.]NUR70612.1 hypothetical protein [Hamadaea sp.]NUT22350.1 hypothetical protein [Hamadaea sp.]